MITKLQLRVFVFLNVVILWVVGINCETFSSPDYYFCNEEKPCTTYALPRANSVYLYLSSAESANLGVRDSEKKRRKRKMRMIGVYTAIAVGLTACIGIGVAFLWVHWRKKQSLSSNYGVDEQQQQLSLSVRTTSDKKVSFEGSQAESYTFEDLQKATQDFSLGNLIQGCVFQGRLRGKTVAVKRVASESALAEIFSGGPNMVRVLGSCVTDGPDSFLVLEYASNGSLKDWIHGGLAMKSHFIASCSCFLSWNQRLKVCVDVATALQHMHHVMSPSYVHRNVSSGNIFLDGDFGAKLGMPKVSEGEEGGTSTDIFAYGVVLLEVLSGKCPTTDEIQQILGSDNAEDLRGWMDSALGESYSFDGAVTLANLAGACVDEDASSRPNAGEVVDKLLRLVEELDLPEFNICESSCRPLVM